MKRRGETAGVVFCSRRLLLEICPTYALFQVSQYHGNVLLLSYIPSILYVQYTSSLVVYVEQMRLCFETYLQTKLTERRNFHFLANLITISTRKMDNE